MVVFNFRLHLFNLCLLFLLFFSPSLFSFLFAFLCCSTLCVIRESFMFPLRMTHAKEQLLFLVFSLFLFLPVFSCLSHANLNRDPNSDEHIIDTNWTSISPAGGNKANEGVAQLSWMSVTDHREEFRFGF